MIRPRIELQSQLQQSVSPTEAAVNPVTPSTGGEWFQIEGSMVLLSWEFVVNDGNL